MKIGALYGGSRGRTALAILVLCILPAVYFAGYFPFTGEAIAPGDSFCELAMRRLAAEQWREGTAPLWNPLSRCGTPLAADPQSGALYPLNILYLALPPVPASNLTLLAHFSLAGILMFWYLKRLGVSGAASLFGAVAYMFSGFLTAHKSHTAMQNAAAWLPLILLCVSEAIRRPRSGFAFLGAAAVAMQILAGHLQVAVLTAVPALIIVLFPPRDTGVRARLAARAGSLFTIFAGGCLLAAVLLVPAFEYARLSPRAAMSYADFTSYSFHPFLLPLLLFPNALGTELPTLFGGYYWGPWNLSELGGGFCGIVTLALAAVAVAALFRSRRAMRLHATIALAAFVLVLGGYTPLYRLLYHLPVYNLFRCPSRNWLVYNFALAALAAGGLDALTGRCARVSPSAVRLVTGRVIGGLLFIAAATGVILALFPSFIASTSFSSNFSLLRNLTPRAWDILGGITLRSNAFLFPIGIMCATALCMYLLRAGYRTGRVFPLLFSVLFIDLLSFGGLHMAAGRTSARLLDEYHYSESVKGLVSFRVGDLSDRRRCPSSLRELISLGARSGEFRVCPFIPDSFSPGNSLTAVMNIFYDIPSSAGYGPLAISHYLDLTDSDWMGRTPDGFVANTSLFSMLNLRYLLCAAGLGPRLESCRGPDGSSPYRRIWEGDGEALYENTACLPRAWLVSRARPVRSYEEARAIMTNPSASFGPREEALVQTESPLPPLGPARGSVGVVRAGPNRISVSYASPSPNLLVLSEIFYPGWRARIDGRQTAILPVNGILRGLRVPPGAHTVEMSYTPGSFRLGIVCSAAAWAVWILGFLCVRRPNGAGRTPTTKGDASDGN